jgi:hypothetical protein
LGKGIATGQQKACQRRGRRREQHQRKVSGNQPAGRRFIGAVAGM